MATPAPKAPVIEKFLNRLTSRSDTTSHNMCLDPPMGCGGPATEFTDSLSRKEFTISGFCQECQDKIYD